MYSDRHSSSRRSRSSLAEAFDPRSNALNAMRLAFAVMVGIGHCALIAFGSRPLHLGSLEIQEVGVDGFFVISGFLITRSWLRSGDTRRYLIRRCSRIFPGYWLALLVTAFALTPMIWLAKHPSLAGFPALGMHGALSFVFANSLLWVGQGHIQGVVAASHLGSSTDGSLWSLFPEFLAYMGVLALGVRGLLKPSSRVAPALLVFLMAMMTWNILNHASFGHALHSPILAGNTMRVFAMFAAGMTLYLWEQRIVMSAPLALCAAAAVVASSVLPQYELLAALPFAYLVLWLGVRLPCTKVGRRYDLSYGVYLYAWPIMQVLATLGLVAWGYVPFTALCLGLSAALAACSWRFVERPAIRWSSGCHPGLGLIASSTVPRMPTASQLAKSEN